MSSPDPITLKLSNNQALHLWGILVGAIDDNNRELVKRRLHKKDGTPSKTRKYYSEYEQELMDNLALSKLLSKHLEEVVVFPSEEAPDPVTPPTPEGTSGLSQATPALPDLELDSLFDLIERKIPDHHLKPKFIADCKIAIKNKIVDELQEAKKWATKAETADQVWQQLDDRIDTLNKLVGDQE